MLTVGNNAGVIAGVILRKGANRAKMQWRIAKFEARFNHITSHDQTTWAKFKLNMKNKTVDCFSNADKAQVEYRCDQV